MSGYRYTYPKGVDMELYTVMSSTNNMQEFRKIQSVYLRAKFNYLPMKIAEITGLSVSRIRHIHSEYKKHGKDSLFIGKRGGRNHCYMTFDDELKFLKSFKTEASEGCIVEVRKIAKKYKEVTGIDIHKSMIYKLLHRHGWRKVFPRPNHPNQNVEAMEAFKKTSLLWLP